MVLLFVVLLMMQMLVFRLLMLLLLMLLFSCKGDESLTRNDRYNISQMDFYL